MSTLPRAFEALLAASLALAAVAHGAAPIVSEVEAPVAIAVRPHPAGGVELIVAGGAPSEIVAVVLLEGAPQSERVIAPQADSVAALGLRSERVLLAAGKGLAVYDLEPRGPVRLASVDAANEAPRFVSVASSERWLFAAGGGRLWRSRWVDRRLAEPRALDGPEGVIAIAMHPRGYLALLTEAAGAVGLEFLDPERPDAPGTRVAVAGLSGPTALAYGGATSDPEPRLYALQADGLYRLDATLAAGRQGARAERVAELRDARAMALAPDGSAFVVAAEGDRPAAVVRLEGKF